ncbi:hypothetical protein [Phreatobacter sp.]|uniref:hypothetical protein n=1 Tax=Phreatobacter sp. TaxID=1966341 RepID=UPI003F72084A
MTAPLAAAAACALLVGCTAVSTVTPPVPSPSPSWAIERQTLNCRVAETGSSRTASAGAGGLFVFGTVATVTRQQPGEACRALLALSDQDIAEIRTFVQATAASGRGLQTNWTAAGGRRRDITLSVYPDGRHQEQPCRTVAASIEVHDGAARPGSAPAVATLDEQRLCQTPAGAWQPL